MNQIDYENNIVGTDLATGKISITHLFNFRPSIMEVESFVEAKPRKRLYNVGRNDPCPCGSGLKF